MGNCAASGRTLVVAKDPAKLPMALAEHLAEDVGIPDDGTAQDSSHYAERLVARGYGAASLDDISLDELAAEPLNFAPDHVRTVARHCERSPSTVAVGLCHPVQWLCMAAVGSQHHGQPPWAAAVG